MVRNWSLALCSFTACAMQTYVHPDPSIGTLSCPSATPGAIVDLGVAAGLTVTGVVLLARPSPPLAPQDQPDLTNQPGLGAAVLWLGALLFVGSAAAGITLEHSCQRDLQEQRRVAAKADAEARATRTREQAWALTQAAAQAARSKDCASVVTASAQVKTIDADFHATVFMRDVAIAACLESSAGK